jgi:hypothetical protein
MVLQYKSKKEVRWKKYPGKDRLERGISNYTFRLLTKDKKKLLSEGNYTKVMKRYRQIEFFKHLHK